MFKVKEFEPRPLIWWFRQMNNIDMKPVFQRKSEIWKLGERKYLIDSILNGFDIPKFYLADNTSYASSPLTSRKKMYSIIDGKQRFNAIFSFFSNEYELAENFEYFSDPKIKIGGLKYTQLKTLFPDIARSLEEYEITVVKVMTDDVDKINQSYIRLNKTSYALAGAEKRNAEKGTIVKMIRMLAKHKFFKKNIRFSITRMQESNAAAKMLLVEMSDDLVDVKKSNLDSLITSYDKSQRNQTELYRYVRKMLDKMSKVFMERDPLLSSQGPLILYYWFIKHNRRDDNGTLRNFLRGFADARHKNDERIKNKLHGVDVELSNYKAFSRSPNDGKSLLDCYDILKRRYEAFKDKAVN